MSRPLARLVTAAAGTGMLAGAWYGLRSEALQRADVRAGDALRRASISAADGVVVSTTDLGSMYAVGGMSALLAGAGRTRTAADVAGLGTLAWTVAQRSKTAVSRARPYETEGVRRLVRRPAGSSFPSGHAAVAAASAALLGGRVRTRGAAWGLGGYAAYVAASRVYVGVHYPSDVIGGAGVGLLLASLWGGPVAAAGRGLVFAGTRLALRAAPVLARAALGVGLRRGRRDTAAEGAEAAAA